MSGVILVPAEADADVAASLVRCTETLRPSDKEGREVFVAGRSFTTEVEALRLPGSVSAFCTFSRGFDGAPWSRAGSRRELSARLLENELWLRGVAAERFGNAWRSLKDSSGPPTETTSIIWTGTWVSLKGAGWLLEVWPEDEDDPEVIWSLEVAFSRVSSGVWRRSEVSDAGCCWSAGHGMRSEGVRSCDDVRDEDDRKSGGDTEALAWRSKSSKHSSGHSCRILFTHRWCLEQNWGEELASWSSSLLPWLSSSLVLSQLSSSTLLVIRSSRVVCWKGLNSKSFSLSNNRGLSVGMSESAGSSLSRHRRSVLKFTALRLLSKEVEQWGDFESWGPFVRYSSNALPRSKKVTSKWT